ncbi:MAG: AAA family ATPase [Candidatus Woesearchaeota archaeon]
MKIVAIVGMTGSGKTEAAKVFVEQGFEYLRFGQAVLDEVKRRCLEVNEKNERFVREDMRKQHGMAVMAKFLIPKFEQLITKANVVADGLYSWEEYTLLKEKFGDELVVLAIYAKPAIRYNRLANRKYDPKKDKKAIYRAYSLEEAKSRDYAEIVNSHKTGPIAMADYTIINEDNVEKLREKVEEFISGIIATK